MKKRNDIGGTFKCCLRPGILSHCDRIVKFIKKLFVIGGLVLLGRKEKEQGSYHSKECLPLTFPLFFLTPK